MKDLKTIKPLPPADFGPTLDDVPTLEPFRFWCQKVLPLVYDDSLSYYELLCKVTQYVNKCIEGLDATAGNVQALYVAYIQLQDWVNHYFDNLDVQNEINIKLDNMLSDGTLTAIINEIVNKKLGNKLLSTADTYLFAQNNVKDIYPDYTQQAFAVGTISGINYMCLFLTNNISSVAVIYNISTGERLRHKVLNLGHCNGATFCSKDNLFYVASSGGPVVSEEVYGIDVNLNVVKTLKYSGINPSSVYYDTIEDVFYCESTNTSNIYVLNYEFTSVVRKMGVPKGVGTNVTYQALSGDTKYLYLVSGGLSYGGDNLHFNKIDVYTHEMQYIGTTFFNNIFELEQIQNVNDIFYFVVQSDKAGYIYKGTIFNDRTIYGSVDDYNLSNLRLTTDKLSVWCNSNYTSFLIDGSYEKPLNNPYLIATIYKKRYTKIDVKLIGDFSNYNFNLKGCPFTEINVSGYTNKTIKGYVNLGGIYVENMFRVQFTNLNIVKRNATMNHCITLFSVTNCNLEKIKVSGSSENSIYAVGSNLAIRGCDFISVPTNAYLYATEGSFVTLENITISSSTVKKFEMRSGANYITSNPPITMIKYGSKEMTSLPMLFFTNYSDTIKNLKMPAHYYFTGGCNVTETPEKKVKSIAVDVTYFSDTVIQYTLYSYEGNIYTRNLRIPDDTWVTSWAKVNQTTVQ